jgi:hypothetical protein
MPVCETKSVVLRRIGGTLLAAALLFVGGCSDDDPPNREVPPTDLRDQPPGTQVGDLDRNQSEQKDQTRPTDP